MAITRNLAEQFFKKIDMNQQNIPLSCVSDEDAKRYLMALIKHDIYMQAVANPTEDINQLLSARSKKYATEVLKRPYMQRNVNVKNWQARILFSTEDDAAPYTIFIPSLHQENECDELIIYLAECVMYEPVNNHNKSRFRFHVLLDDVIGQGSFGEVFDTIEMNSAGQSENEKKGYVIKKFFAEKEFAEQNAESEQKILRLLGSQKDVVMIDDNYYVVMRKMRNMITLEEYLKLDPKDSANKHNTKYQAKAAPISLANFFKIIINLLHMVADFHARGALHRDLKPANIMINPITFEVGLIDVGLGRDITEPDNRGVGTVGYAPPEMVDEDFPDSDRDTDIFAIGSIISDFHFSGAINLDLYPTIAKILEIMTILNPDDRYKDVATVLHDIESERFSLLFNVNNLNFHNGNALARNIYQQLATLREQNKFGSKPDVVHFISTQRKLMREVLELNDHPDFIAEFLTVLHVQAFLGLTTRQQIVDKATEIVDDYYLRSEQLVILWRRFLSFTADPSLQDDYEILHNDLDYLIRKVAKCEGTFDEMARLNKYLQMVDELQKKYSTLFIENYFVGKKLTVADKQKYIDLHYKINISRNKKLLDIDASPTCVKLVQGIQAALEKYLMETLTPENIADQRKIAAPDRIRCLDAITENLAAAKSAADLVLQLDHLLQQNTTRVLGIFHQFKSRLFRYIDAAINEYKGSILKSSSLTSSPANKTS